MSLYTKGGQTAAHEPYMALRIFACGSLNFPKNYIFVFYFLHLLQSVEILQNGAVVASVS